MLSPHVILQVARLGELLVAHVALERLLPRVRPHVSLQFARLGELLVATLPCALVRLLPRMDHHVPLQVRAMHEDLLADRTDMRLPNLQGLREFCI